jgi:hypothetical protein
MLTLLAVLWELKYLNALAITRILDQVVHLRGKTNTNMKHVRGFSTSISQPHRRFFHLAVQLFGFILATILVGRLLAAYKLHLSALSKLRLMS